MKITLTAILISISLLPQLSFSQEKDEATTAKIKSFLASKYKDAPAEGRKFLYNEVDLNDDGKNEFLVGLMGSYFCGSGGCNMLVLDPNLKILTSMTVVGYPVYVGAPGGSEVTKHYSNLYVYSKGKGNVVLKWNGKTYPKNPSMESVVPESAIEGKFKFLNAGEDPVFDF